MSPQLPRTSDPPELAPSQPSGASRCALSCIHTLEDSASGNSKRFAGHNAATLRRRLRAPAHPLFRDRWIATTVSVRRHLDAGHGRHLVDDLADQLASAHRPDADRSQLPVLILGLLAGATADIFDRRKLLIFWQAWMLGSVGLLAVLTFFGYVSPWTLLALTFCSTSALP